MQKKRIKHRSARNYNGDYTSLEINNTFHSETSLSRYAAKQAVAIRLMGVQGQSFQKEWYKDSHVPGSTVTGAVYARLPKESSRVNSIYVSTRSAQCVHRDKARASSEINHPGHRIGGLLAKRLNRGTSSTHSDNATKRLTSPGQRRRVKRNALLRICPF